MEVIEHFDGRPFPTTLGLARQWATGRLRRSLVVAGDDLLRRARGHHLPDMGLLPDKRPASWYDPGRFWSGDRTSGPSTTCTATSSPSTGRALEQELPGFQFALLDGDTVVAEGHTAPIAWDGDEATLPAGIDDALRAAVLARRAGAPVDTLCAMAAEVSPAARRRGLAAEVLRGMSALARRHGLRRFRGAGPPVVEGALPAHADRALRHLAPRRRASSWTPWMRLHERLGARVFHTARALDADHRHRGPEWEAWTGALRAPEEPATTSSRTGSPRCEGGGDGVSAGISSRTCG